MPIFRRKKKKEEEIEVIDVIEESETEKPTQKIEIPPPIRDNTSPVVPVIPTAPTIPSKPTKTFVPIIQENKQEPVSPPGVDNKAIPSFHSIKSHLPPPIPASIISTKKEDSESDIQPPELPGMSSTAPTRDVRRQLDDTPLPQEQSVISELRGVLSSGGGLHKAPEKEMRVITKSMYQEDFYLKTANDYEEAGKKQEEAELWQTASMNYVLAVLSLYLSKDISQAAKYLTILVKTNPLLAVSNPVLKLRGFLEEMLKKHKANAIKSADEMFTLPYQYRDDIDIVKKAIRKAKEEIDKF